MLNPNAQKWVAALRSDEFHQINGKLSDGNGGCCCLGVGSILYERETGEKLHDGWMEETTLSGRVGCVRLWLGLMTVAGDYGPRDEFGAATSCLTADNDNDNGKTFAEIADIIESEPEELFA